jgi:hypothetical protein
MRRANFEHGRSNRGVRRRIALLLFGRRSFGPRSFGRLPFGLRTCVGDRHRAGRGSPPGFGRVHHLGFGRRMRVRAAGSCNSLVLRNVSVRTDVLVWFMCAPLREVERTEHTSSGTEVGRHDVGIKIARQTRKIDVARQFLSEVVTNTGKQMLLLHNTAAQDDSFWGKDVD